MLHRLRCRHFSDQRCTQNLSRVVQLHTQMAQELHPKVRGSAGETMQYADGVNTTSMRAAAAKRPQPHTPTGHPLLPTSRKMSGTCENIRSSQRDGACEDFKCVNNIIHSHTLSLCARPSATVARNGLWDHGLTHCPTGSWHLRLLNDDGNDAACGCAVLLTPSNHVMMTSAN